jgi:hypothetical protein
MAHLSRWPDLVLFVDDEEQARRLESEGAARGHVVERKGTRDYGPAYVEEALGCGPLGQESLRVTFLPSFHAERIVTATRTATVWRVELRVSRESLWYTRFSPVPFEAWPEVVRTPGVDVVTADVPRADVADAERALVRLARVQPPDDSRIGVDGMSAGVTSRLSDAEFVEELWSPPVGSRVRAAVDLAVDLVRATGATSCEFLAMYLTD